MTTLTTPEPPPKMTPESAMWTWEIMPETHLIPVMESARRDVDGGDDDIDHERPRTRTRRSSTRARPGRAASCRDRPAARSRLHTADRRCCCRPSSPGPSGSAVSARIIPGVIMMISRTVASCLIRKNRGESPTSHSSSPLVPAPKRKKTEVPTGQRTPNSRAPGPPKKLELAPCRSAVCTCGAPAASARARRPRFLRIISRAALMRIIPPHRP